MTLLPIRARTGSIFLYGNDALFLASIQSSEGGSYVCIMKKDKAAGGQNGWSGISIC